MLEFVSKINREQQSLVGDPEIQSRIAQYEMAYRMQTSVPELTDISDEPQHVLNMYGIDEEVTSPFGRQTLLARRLVERGVSFVGVHFNYMTKCDGWDTHKKHSESLKKMLMPTMDQAFTALLSDLDERGLLEETLVVWFGESANGCSRRS